jgi:hypothetical protein
MRLMNLAIVILLAGCATTSYGPRGMVGGYSDKKLADDTWEVTFVSNYRSAEGYALSAALYRSAELASAAGFPYFQIVRFKGSTTRVGMRGSESYAGQTIELKVHGATSPDVELVCEHEDSRKCRTLSTERILREMEPVVKKRTSGGS